MSNNNRASGSSKKMSNNRFSGSSRNKNDNRFSNSSAEIENDLEIQGDGDENETIESVLGIVNSPTIPFTEMADDEEDEDLITMISDFETDISDSPKDDKNVPKKHPYADDIIAAIKPYIWFMKPLLRFPLHLKKNPDGTYLFYYNRKSCIGPGFAAVSWLIAIIGVLVLFNTIGSVVDFPGIQTFKDPTRLNTVQGNYRYEERYIFRRNIITVIVIILNLMFATVTNYNLFTKRHFAAHYLTFWTEAVEVFQIDVAYELKKYVLTLVGYFGGFLLLFTSLCLMRFAPAASGGPAILTILTTRGFYPQVHTLEYFWILRGFGGVLFLYVMICTKSFMILFLIICRLMRNGFLVWNHRLDRILHRGEIDNSTKERWEKRTTFDQLFKDHIMLLDLLEGGDTLFATIIECYYGTQLISIIFEFYYFYKSVTSFEDFRGARRLDAILIGLYVAHSLAFLFAVSLAASNVGEEAGEGLEILRRKNLMGKKADDELYFTLSLYNSYTGPLETALTGGRYFVLDKGLLAGILGAIFSYFIILSQFSPLLLLTTTTEKIVETYENQKLLNHVENTYDYFGFEVGLLRMKQNFIESEGNVTIFTN